MTTNNVLTELPSAPVPRRRRWALWIGAVSVVLVGALVAAAVSFVQWRDSPKVLSPHITGTVAFGQVAVGHTLYADFGLEGPSPKTIHITGIRLHVVANTAGATITLVRLPIKKGQPGVGTMTGEPGWYTANGPATGAWTLGSPTQILYAITPHRAGQVVIEGGDVSYRIGLRRGTQWAGLGVRVGATG